jgi:hypothetical protein
MVFSRQKSPEVNNVKTCSRKGPCLSMRGPPLRFVITGVLPFRQLLTTPVEGQGETITIVLREGYHNFPLISPKPIFFR